MPQLKTLDQVAVFSPQAFVRKRVWESAALHCNVYAFEPGQQNAMHHHPNSDEVVMCWEGNGRAVIGNEVFALRPRATLLVPAGVPHGYVNTDSTRRMIITVVQCPQPVVHVADSPGDVAELVRTLEARS